MATPPRLINERGAFITLKPEVLDQMTEPQRAAYLEVQSAHAEMVEIDSAVATLVKKTIPEAVVHARVSRGRLDRYFKPLSQVELAQAWIRSQRGLNHPINAPKKKLPSEQ